MLTIRSNSSEFSSPALYRVSTTQLFKRRFVERPYMCALESTVEKYISFRKTTGDSLLGHPVSEAHSPASTTKHS